jgi:hypothetical protein
VAKSKFCLIYDKTLGRHVVETKNLLVQMADQTGRADHGLLSRETGLETKTFRRRLSKMTQCSEIKRAKVQA